MLEAKHVLRSNTCNYCGGELKPDKYDFYRCDECESEFWIKPFEKSEAEQALAVANEYISRSMVQGAVESGGSKTGKVNKERLKKRPAQKVYEQLFKQT